ncbi:MAG: phytoene/squalene synthase family protein [bacterium]|nr:MAG: phytoene/squalene synthase family protein [bacterium]
MIERDQRLFSQRGRDKDLKMSLKYARSQTAFYSKSFFLSSALLPKEKRWDTYALYSFCRYADNIVDRPRNRTPEELIQEVDALATELHMAYKTRESEHPVIKSFIHVAMKYQIPIIYPMELLEGVKMDLERNRYETFDDLYLFAYRVAGVVGILMTYVLGYKDDSAFEYAEKLGVAMQLTNILRDVQEDKNMGRIYLPQQEIEQFNLQEEDFFNENITTNFRKFMNFQVNRAHRYYLEAHDGIKLLTENTQFAIYAASKIYQGILLKIEARNYNPFLGRVFVSQGKKLLILLGELLRTRFLRPVFTMFS